MKIRLTKILVVVLALSCISGFAVEGLIIENKKTIGDKYLESYLERIEISNRVEEEVVVETTPEVKEETQEKTEAPKAEETPVKEENKTPAKEENNETPKQEEPKKEETKPYNVLNSTETYTITKSFGASEVERKYIEAAKTVDIPSEYKDEVVKFINAINNCTEAELKYEIITDNFRYWSMLEYYTRVKIGGGIEFCYDQISKKASHKDVDGVTVYTLTIDIAHAKNVFAKCEVEAEKYWSEREAKQAELDKDYEAKLAQENKMRNYIKNAANSISLNGNKVHDLRQVHDWVCRNVSYDNSGANYNIYHLVDTGKTQCSGYARVFQRICNYIGINVQYCDGYGKTSAHAWNSVKVDGATYYIDCTWDDTLSNTQYFLKTAEQFSQDHSW